MHLALLPLALTLALTPAQDEQGLRLRPTRAAVPEDPVVVPMKMRGPMPAVEVMVNGQGPFLFAIDSGGSGAARVDSTLVEKLGLESVGEIQGSDGMTGSVPMAVFELDSLELGGARFEGVRAPSRSYNRSPRLPHIDGILGYHLFSGHALTLDYAGEEVSLHRGPYAYPEGAQPVALTSGPDDIPRLTAKLGEQELEGLAIDTGKMSGLGIPEALAEELTWNSPPVVIGRGRTVSGEFEVKRGHVDAVFQLGDVRADDPEVDMAAPFTFAILGSSFLAPYLITFDTGAGKVWLRTPGEDARLRSEPVAAPIEKQWNQWRGPDRNGRVAAGGAPTTWAEAYARAWSTEVGAGHSSPVVAHGRVFTLTRMGESEVVTAVELESGRIAWREEYPVEIGVNPYAKGHGRWPRSTPLAVDGRLFTIGADATLSAWDAKTGELLWRHARKGGVDTSQLFCGTSTSPIHHAGRVFVHVGDDAGGAMIAYEAKDGSEVWRTELEGPGYASPIRLEPGGVAQLVTLTASRVVAMDLEDGELLWSVPFEDEWNENIVTPLAHGQEVVVAGVRNGMRSLHPVPPDPRGETQEAAAWRVETKWVNRRAGLYMSSPVADGETLYGFSKDRRGQLMAVSLADGAILWTHAEAADNASIVLAGERLVVLTTEGELIVGTSTPKGWAPEQRHEVAPSPTWAHPILLPDGFLIKDSAELVRWRASSSGK